MSKNGKVAAPLPPPVQGPLPDDATDPDPKVPTLWPACHWCQPHNTTTPATWQLEVKLLDMDGNSIMAATVVHLCDTHYDEAVELAAAGALHLEAETPLLIKGIELAAYAAAWDEQARPDPVLA